MEEVSVEEEGDFIGEKEALVSADTVLNNTPNKVIRITIIAYLLHHWGYLFIIEAT